MPTRSRSLTNTKLCDICECARTKNELEVREGADGIYRCAFCNIWRFHDINFEETWTSKFLLFSIPQRPYVILDDTNLIYW